ncbi:hypothetical protein BU15DRAFT_60718 [Melanogaster broomeanus]|nr:hypothetical protein BU15DRAFT_60718 [Melanogaster broomeanus]
MDATEKASPSPSPSPSLSLQDFSAYDLPTKKAMGLFCPKMRLRLRIGEQILVSTLVKAGNSGGSTEPRQSPTRRVSHTRWDDVLSPALEVYIEKRNFLFGYTCIRQTERVSIRSMTLEGGSDNHELPLYDGQRNLQHGQGVTMGNVTFEHCFRTPCLGPEYSAVQSSKEPLDKAGLCGLKVPEACLILQRSSFSLGAKWIAIVTSAREPKAQACCCLRTCAETDRVSGTTRVQGNNIWNNETLERECFDN